MSVPFRRQRGFTLVELLVVTGVIAIIAAIATMSYRTAIERARQRRTVNDMRMIAGAWEARAADTNSYNVAGFTFPETEVATTDFYRALVPTYSKHLSLQDGWNRPLELGVGEGKQYGIRSAGADGAFQEGPYVVGDTTEFDCDIVYANGAFVAAPAGAQTKQ